MSPLKKAALLLSFWVWFFPLAKAQSYQKQRREIIAYNVLSTATTAAIGALINKKKNEKWFPVFYRSFLSGAVGGYLMHEGKNLLFHIKKKESLYWGWPAKLIFFAGSSIAENVSANRKPWERFHMNFGFVRLQFEPMAKEKLSATILLSELTTTFMLATRGSFDIKRSLQFGNTIFTSNRSLSNNGDRLLEGYALGESFIVNRSYFDTARSFFYYIVTHEAVHTFQNNNFITVNPYFKKISDSVAVKSKLFNKTRNFFTLDLDQPLFWGLYYLEDQKKTGTYFRNFFEYEAQHYTLRQWLQR